MIFVFLSGCSSAEKSNEKMSVKENVKKLPSADKLIVYYFHTEYRCWSCNQFEKLTQEVLEESFKEKVEQRKIEFIQINVETNQNKHYIEDYKLVTKSIILSLQYENKQIDWRNMDKIWMLVRDTEKFKMYIKKGITNYLYRVKQS
jgi:thioredoxin-related protein